MVNLTGKTALITGASSGIGAATAIHFASLGCAVAINGRNSEKLKKTSDQCIAKGLSELQVLIVVGDISKDEEAIAVVDKTIRHFGQLDILVNNAGICIPGTLVTATLEGFDQTMSTNLRGHFHMTKLCAPHLKKSRGNIVNVSGITSHQAMYQLHAAAMSKAGLDVLTRTSARELAMDQVRVNAVVPGAVVTDVFENMGLTKEQADALWEDRKRFHALNRIADAEEVAKPIAFLASDDASFVTGSLLLVDGGFTLMGADINF